VLDQYVTDDWIPTTAKTFLVDFHTHLL